MLQVLNVKPKGRLRMIRNISFGFYDETVTRRISALKASTEKIVEFENREHPYKVAHNEPPPLGLHYLPSFLGVVRWC